MVPARIRPQEASPLITVDLSKAPQLNPPLTSAKFKITQETTGDQLMAQIFTRTGILPKDQQLTVTYKGNIGNRTALGVDDQLVDPTTKISSYFMTLSIAQVTGKDPVYPILHLTKV